MLYNECIRGLYEAAADLPPASFPRVAMGRAAALLPCAAVLWQIGDEGGGVTVRRIAALDMTVDAAQLDGIVLTDLESQRQAAEALQMAVASVQLPRMAASHHIAFVRAQPGTFTPQETELLAQLAEHMVGAEQLCHRVASKAERPPAPPDQPDGIAVATPDARVVLADRRFSEMMRSAMPEWDGQTVPFSLHGTESRVHSGLFISIEPQGGNLLLRMRSDRRSPALSDRETEIARRIGAGLTFKEIARELAVAPSTVSTHLYKLYAKLGIRRRSELVSWLAGERD